MSYSWLLASTSQWIHFRYPTGTETVWPLSVDVALQHAMLDVALAFFKTIFICRENKEVTGDTSLYLFIAAKLKDSLLLK